MTAAKTDAALYPLAPEAQKELGSTFSCGRDPRGADGNQIEANATPERFELPRSNAGHPHLLQPLRSVLYQMWGSYAADARHDGCLNCCAAQYAFTSSFANS
jgi:hypothetical protein